MNNISILFEKENVDTNLEMGFSYLKSYFECSFKNQIQFVHSENPIQKNIHYFFVNIFHFFLAMKRNESLCVVVASCECCT